MSPEERERILTRAITRPDSKLVRRLTSGIVGLGRQLQLNTFLPAAQQRKLTPAEADEQTLATVWLLDRRNSLDLIRTAAALGWDSFRASYLTGKDEASNYRFNLPAVIQAAANSEVELSVEEIAAADVTVVPKPRSEDGPAPPGES